MTVPPPNTIPWPPLLACGSALVAILFGRVWPWAGPEMPGVGLLLVLAGLVLDASAVLAMRRRRANILPTRAATALVTGFPFNLSRNPIYLGNTLMLAGAGLALGHAWLLVAAVANAVSVHHLAILREEAHLAALFGAEWQAYAARVPRWLIR